MKGGRRAQSSVEYIAILGFLLLTITLFFLQASDDVSTKIRDTTAIAAVERMATTANEVYKLGPGSKLHVWIEMPPNAVDYIIENNELGLRVELPDGRITDISKYVDANLTGKFDYSRGSKKIPFEMLDSGLVLVGCGLNLNPSTLTYYADPSDSFVQIFNLSNGCNKPFINLATSSSGQISSWIVSNQPENNTIDIGEWTNFTSTITVPGASSPGTYTGFITVNGNDSYAEVPVTVIIRDRDPPTAYNGSPTGILIEESRPTISVYSDEAATCRGSIGTDNTYDSMDFTFSGNGLYHEYVPNTMANGQKVVYVRCRDTSGNTMTSSYTWFFEISINQSISSTPPTVTLNSPADLSVISKDELNFTFTATHPKLLAFTCTLWITEGTEKAYGTLGLVENGVLTTITANQSLNPGIHTWRVTCSTGAAKDTSTTWTFSISSPTKINSTSDKDGHIRANKATNNYGASTYLDTQTRAASSRYFRTLIAFDLSGIAANSEIFSAELFMYLYSDATPVNVNVYRLTQNWIEGTGDGSATGDGATWDTYDGTTAWATAGGDFDTTIWSSLTVGAIDQWYAWNITDLVKGWVNATYSNNGMILINDEVTADKLYYSSEYATTSLRPYLKLSFYNGTGVDDLTPPTVTLSAPGEGQIVNTSTITFQYVPNDIQSGIASCALFINGTLNQTDTSITKGVVNSFIVAGFSNASYSWSVNCTDSSLNANVGASNTINFSVDTASAVVYSPTIVLNNPAEGATSASADVTFQYTPDDLDSGIASCDMIFDGTTNQTNVTITESVVNEFTILGISEGPHTWSISCTDDSPGANVGSSVTRNLTVSIPVNQAPTVTLNSPTNGQTIATSSYTFLYTPNDVDSGIASCSLTLDGSIDQTDVTITEGISNDFPVTGLTNGPHTWNVSCTDDDAVPAVGTSLTWSFTVSLPVNQAPTVTLNSPTNGQTLATSSYTFQYTPNDVDSGIASCSLTLDGSIDQTDVTITEGIINTFPVTGLTNGPHTWNVSCTDDDAVPAVGTSPTWSFSVSLPQEADCLVLDGSTAYLTAGSKTLNGVNIQNTCGSAVTVTGAIVTWAGGGYINWFRINAVDGWNGNVGSGTLLDFGASSVPIPATTTYETTARFGTGMAGTTITIEYIMQDASTKSTTFSV